MKARIIAISLLCGLILTFITACETIPVISTDQAEKRTLFIYMCGSSLETKQGLAGKNIDELLSANAGEDLNIVIETGGTGTWRAHGIANNAIQRYEVKDGNLELIETLPDASMGEAQTLSDFLVWGQENYQTEHNMFLFWNHGAGSANGICFDENHFFDSLLLDELKTAFDEATLKNKFDIIGFDACLMASLETACIIEDYADYMVASEDIEPSGGWDYNALIESLSAGDDPALTGRKICDTYITKCQVNGKELTSTLSLFDLSKTDTLCAEWISCAHKISKTLRKKNYASKIHEAIGNCIKFGGDNTTDGSSNMIDMLDFLKQSDYTKSEFPDIYAAYRDFVLYTVNGCNRNISGLSFFYPVVYDKRVLKKYVSLSVMEEYNDLLRKYFLDVPKKTIGFVDKGSISKNGAFTIALTQNSMRYLRSIDFMLMKVNKNAKGSNRRLICMDNDIAKLWKKCRFKSNFKGISLALDGHRLFSNAISDNGQYVSFNAPVIVNGKQTSLRFIFLWDYSADNNGDYKITGLWNGVDENGMPDNEITPLKPGDKVQIVTGTDKGKKIIGDKFTIGNDGGKITELPLDGKEYKYVFVVTDIFGNKFFSDMATFKMTKTYEELLAHPLSDRHFAARVTKIEPYKAKYSGN